ncbi:MAG: hypothetical protein WB995_00445 [Candidatus Acidiferrales bacterium]|jgi:hypothetical protein
MAEAAPAKKGALAPSQINLALTGAPVPLTSSVPINGSVEFINLPPSPVTIWTWDASGALANIFTGEQNHCVPCQLGGNGPFSFDTSKVAVGDTLNFQANSKAPVPHGGAIEKDALTGVKGTIKVTSMAGD